MLYSDTQNCFQGYTLITVSHPLEKSRSHYHQNQQRCQQLHLDSEEQVKGKILQTCLRRCSVFLSLQPVSGTQMGLKKKTTVSDWCNVQTGKMQISLHICAVSSVFPYHIYDNNSNNAALTCPASFLKITISGCINSCSLLWMR